MYSFPEGGDENNEETDTNNDDLVTEMLNKWEGIYLDEVWMSDYAWIMIDDFYITVNACTS